MSLRNWIPRIAVIALMACAGGGFAPPALADTLKSRLEEVEKNLTNNREKRDELNRAAEQTAKELKEIQQRGIRLAKSLYRFAARADALESRLADLQEQERSKAQAMARRQGQLAATLSALQRMARMPAATSWTSAP